MVHQGGWIFSQHAAHSNTFLVPARRVYKGHGKFDWKWVKKIWFSWRGTASSNIFIIFLLDAFNPVVSLLIYQYNLWCSRNIFNFLIFGCSHSNFGSVSEILLAKTVWFHLLCFKSKIIFLYWSGWKWNIT